MNKTHISVLMRVCLSITYRKNNTEKYGLIAVKMENENFNLTLIDVKSINILNIECT